MKRFTWLVLACAVLVLGQGCRRGGGGGGQPRPPIKLDSETDILAPKIFDDADLAKAMRPKDKIKIAVRGDGGGFDFPKEALEPGASIQWGMAQTAEEKQWLQKAQAELQRLAVELDQKRKQENLNKVGEAYLVFVQKYSPNLQTFENFKLHLRRERLAPLRRLVEEGQFVPVFPADANIPGQILVYQASAENGRHSCFQSNSMVAALAPGEIEAKIAAQKLQAAPK